MLLKSTVVSSLSLQLLVPSTCECQIHVYKMCSPVKKTTDVPTEIGHCHMHFLVFEENNKQSLLQFDCMQLVMHQVLGERLSRAVQNCKFQVRFH